MLKKFKLMDFYYLETFSEITQRFGRLNFYHSQVKITIAFF